MSLDVKTICIAYIAVSFFLSVLFFTGNRFRKIEYVFWNLANATTFIGFLLLLFQGTHPGYLMIILPNTLVIAALCFNSISVLMFLERRYSLLFYAVVLGFCFAAMTYSTFVRYNTASRVVSVSLSAIVLVVYTIWGVTVSYRKNRSVYSFYIDALYVIFLAALGFRVFSAFGKTNLSGVIIADYSLSVLLFVQLFCLIGWNILIYMIMIERYKCEVSIQYNEIKRLHEEARDQAVHDPLTGLYNRRYLADRLDEECERARIEGYPVSFALIDIDDFKKINDSYGHDAGDLVLQSLSSQLRSQVRANDIVCRYGGDEILVVLSHVSSEKASELSETWRREFYDTSVPWNDFFVRTTLSVGIAVFPHHGADADAVIKSADIALYKSKVSGRNRVSVFTAADN